MKVNLKKLSLAAVLAMILALIPFVSVAASYPALPVFDEDTYDPVIGNNYSVAAMSHHEVLLIFGHPDLMAEEPVIVSAVSSNESVVKTGLNLDDPDLYNCVDLYFTGGGNATVTVTDSIGTTSIIEVDVTQRPAKLSAASATIEIGSSKQLKLKYAAHKVKWKSSNKKVAVVSKSGKVKAKKKGYCTITAKSGGKTYKCRIHVIEPRVLFFADIETYVTRNNYFEVRIRNNSSKNLYITSGERVLHSGYKEYDRRIYLTKQVKIKPGATKRIRFYVSGGYTYPDCNYFTLYYRFRFNGKNRQGRVSTLSCSYKSGGKWKKPYPNEDSEKYEDW